VVPVYAIVILVQKKCDPAIIIVFMHACPVPDFVGGTGDSQGDSLGVTIRMLLGH